MVWLRNSFLLGALAILGLVVQGLAGGNAGWWVFSLGVMGLLGLHLRNLQRVLNWCQHLDEMRPAPLAAGGWGEMLARLQRHMRKRERALRESQDTLHTWLAAAQALPDGVVVLDSEMNVDWSNREASRWLGLKFPEDRGHPLLNLARSPEFVHYAQQTTWNDSAVVPAPADPNALVRVRLIRYSRERRLLVVRDVTQSERLERMRRDFVANVSHELRTPLTVLTGFLETLHEAPPGALESEQAHHYLGLMREQASRMESIVADLLTLSTLESTRAHQDPGPAGVPVLLRSVREQAEALSSGRHQFFWEVDASVDVKGMPAELLSALSNLATNAVRYTPDGGTITVRWQLDVHGRAVYAVHDTGVGIEATHLPRLAERFYRVDRSRSRASGGTGLGLAITKQVAVRHEAELEIESEPGQGSVFRLVFDLTRLARLPNSGQAAAVDTHMAPVVQAHRA